MKRLFRQLLARMVLGTGVIKHLLTLPFIGRRIPAPWLSRLRDELLAPAPTELWEYVDGTSRCIGCGLCDVMGTVEETPSHWIMGEAREPSTASLAAGIPERLQILAEDISRICPARVPVGDIARLLSANQRRLSGEP
ncbi:MAG: hypothetical protein VX699_04805 [Myxococcota bacterium]|nr:hypothetical protein [Myxococcota bacterium]